MKSKPRTRLAPQKVRRICGKATKLPSLSRSGGRFFIVLCLGLFGSLPDDDRHGPLPEMEGQTHTHHLLSEGWNQPPACLYERSSSYPCGRSYSTQDDRICQQETQKPDLHGAAVGSLLYIVYSQRGRRHRRTRRRFHLTITKHLLQNSPQILTIVNAESGAFGKNLPDRREKSQNGAKMRETVFRFKLIFHAVFAIFGTF